MFNRIQKTAFDCQQQEKVLEERLQSETAQLKKVRQRKSHSSTYSNYEAELER